MTQRRLNTMARLISALVLLSALSGCVGKRVVAAEPALIVASDDNLAPHAPLHNYAHWFGRCESLTSESGFTTCDEQRFKLMVVCDGVPCVAEPAGVLTAGVEMEGSNNHFVVRPQGTGTLTVIATMTHVDSGETLSAMATSVVRDPERLELTCSYTDYDAGVSEQACPTAMGTYSPNAFFSFAVRGVLGDERLWVQPSWTLAGWKPVVQPEDTIVVEPSSHALHPSGPGPLSVRVTYGSLSAEYEVVLE